MNKCPLQRSSDSASLERITELEDVIRKKATITRQKVLVIHTAPRKNSHKLMLLCHQRYLLRMLVLVGKETRNLYQQKPQVQWRHQTTSIQNLDQQVFSTTCQ